MRVEGIAPGASVCRPMKLYWSHPSRRFVFIKNKNAPDTFDQTAVHRQGYISIKNKAWSIMICSYAADRQTYCKPLDSASFRVFLFLDYMLPYLVPFVKGFDKKYFDLYKLHKI